MISDIDSKTSSLLKGLEAIKHRGPDASNHVTVNSVFLGHNRLSIIDLSEVANQPIKSVNSNAQIIFNGEIYNYKLLRNELIGKGVKFTTASDTEVILEGYLSEGVSFFKKLRGIYSFAIYDNRKIEKVILARDPSGIKPLYLFKNNSIVIFGSEIKAIVPVVKDSLTINEDIIKIYLNLSYCPEPFTIYNEVEAVRPGSYIEMTHDSFIQEQFLKFDFNSENKNSLEENIRITKAKLNHAIESNLVADVEIAVALSGGIDSSLVYAVANNLNKGIKGLTVSFDDTEYDEAGIATEYAKHLNGNQTMIKIRNDFSLETLKKLFIHFDQPYADSSAIPMYYLTKGTRKYTKVLLGGDGGDELYNGYPSQTRLPFIYSFSRFPIVRTILSGALSIGYSIAPSDKKRMVARVKGLVSARPSALIYEWKSWFSRHTNYKGESPFVYKADEGLNLYMKKFSRDLPESFSHKVLHDYYTKTLLSDYLRKTDMMSMLNAVEYRVPLLEEDLVSFALTVPHSQKSDLKVGKKILRAIHSEIYPPKTSNAPKKGFAIPLDVYLSDADLKEIKESLLMENGIVLKYIKKDYIEFLFEAIKNKSNDSTVVSRAGIYQQILIFYSLFLWYDGFTNLN